jgi:hypothetical protein
VLSQPDRWLQIAAPEPKEIIMTSIRIGILATATAAALIASLSTALAYQPTSEQRSACMSDVIKLCASDIPNTDRIINCLARQKAQVSPRCRVFFDRAGL